MNNTQEFLSGQTDMLYLPKKLNLFQRLIKDIKNRFKYFRDKEAKQLEANEQFMDSLLQDILEKELPSEVARASCSRKYLLKEEFRERNILLDREK